MTASTGRAGRGLYITPVGAAQIKRAFKLLPKAVAKRVIRKAMRPALKGVAAKVKELVPVDTGLTRDSVKVRAAKRSKRGFGLNVQIGEGDYQGQTFYAAFVEYGTIRMPGRHFMRAAFESEREEAARTAERLLGDLIFEAVKQLKAKDG